MKRRVGVIMVGVVVTVLVAADSAFAGRYLGGLFGRCCAPSCGVATCCDYTPPCCIPACYVPVRCAPVRWAPACCVPDCCVPAACTPAATGGTVSSSPSEVPPPPEVPIIAPPKEPTIAPPKKTEQDLVPPPPDKKDEIPPPDKKDKTPPPPDKKDEIPPPPDKKEPAPPKEKVAEPTPPEPAKPDAKIPDFPPEPAKTPEPAPPDKKPAKTDDGIFNVKPEDGLINQNNSGKMRLWTDDTGAYQVEAKFVSFQDGTVRLQKANGRYVRVDINRLSADDQQIVHQGSEAIATTR
jgi:hypothetical protein